MSPNVGLKPQLILSPIEWRFMTAVWELRQADAAEVADFLKRRYGRVYPVKTAGIFLGRLAKKGFLQHMTSPPIRPGRPAHIYSPTIGREDALRRQFQQFLADHEVREPDLVMFESLLASPVRHPS